MHADEYSNIMQKLRSLANPDNAEGMKRFAITGKQVLGIKVPVLREIARDTGKDHETALNLWESEVHEARILATMIEYPDKISEEQMDIWVSDIDSWDLCDHFCGNLVMETPFFEKKISDWSAREEEFVRRAAFVIIAEIAARKGGTQNRKFEEYLKIIARCSTDERNFVRKAVNWALRNIGKRNAELNRMAIAAAEKISSNDSKSARWIASDALRELRSESVRRRIEKN